MPEKELRKKISQDQMTLPPICRQCPYRRTMQQLLGLWDQNLMKQTGINNQEQLINQLRQTIQVLESRLSREGEEQ